MTDAPPPTTTTIPTFAEWKKNKAAYLNVWGKRRNPALRDFQDAVKAMAIARGWPVRKVVRWVSRRTGVSDACLYNWLENGPTRHPTMRTFPYVMRVGFGITYERKDNQAEPIDLAVARQRLGK